MKTVNLGRQTAQLKRMIRDADGETVVILDSGKPVAAVVPLADTDSETLSLSTNRKFLAILRRSFDELDAGKAISMADMRKRLGMRRGRD